MPSYIVSCDGETASPVFESVSDAEDFRELLIVHYKNYLPVRFQIELAVPARDRLDQDIIDQLEDEAREWAAENRRIRQTLADLCLDLRTRLDKV